MKLSGSMAYLRMVLILKVLSIRIEGVWSSLSTPSARAIAACSARLIVCLSDWDFISICGVVCVLGLILDAASVGLPVTRDPSVWMRSFGFHARDMCGFAGVQLFMALRVRRSMLLCRLKCCQGWWGRVG